MPGPWALLRLHALDFLDSQLLDVILHRFHYPCLTSIVAYA